MRPSTKWLGPILALGLASAALWCGCGGGGDSQPEEVAEPEATIELQNDLGEIVDAFPEGGAAFASFADLDPWTAYEITLRSPGPSAIATAEKAAEQANEERMEATGGEGPSDMSTEESRAQRDTGGDGSSGMDSRGPLGGPDAGESFDPEGDSMRNMEGPDAGLDMSRATTIGTNIVAAPEDEAGPEDPAPVDDTTTDEAADEPLVEGNEPTTHEAPGKESAHGTTEDQLPAGEGDGLTEGASDELAPEGADGFPGTEGRDAAKQAADQISPMPEMPLGNVVGGGTYISDADGLIPPTLLARDLGIAPEAGLGAYTISIEAVGGRSWGSETFDVVENEDPFCYPCTPDGTLKTAFDAGGETLYVRVENLPAHAEVDVYVVADKGTYSDEEQLADVSGSITYAQADEEGCVLIDVWTGCEESGAYDLFVDLNNNMAFERAVDLEDGTKSKDALYGGRTTGLVVQEQAAVRGELDLSTEMVCTADVYTEGLSPRLGSDKALYIRAIPTFIGGPLGAEASIYVVKHRDAWQSGDALETVAGTVVKTQSGGPWGVERTLVWPAPILPGAYDIIVDTDGDGLYTRGTDLIDNTSARDGEVEVGCVVTDAGNLIAVRGKVVDTSGEPIQGALVSSTGAADAPVETAADGTYTLLQALPRRIEIEAAAASYQRSKVTAAGEPSTEALDAPDIRLAAVSNPGNDYMPLASGNEWEYDVSRTIDGALPVGPLAEYVGPIEYTGNMLRYVDGPDTTTIPTITLLPLVEEETVFMATQSSEGSGDRSFARTSLIEPTSDGLLFRETSEALPRTWLPASLASGDEFVAWVPVGPYKVIGAGTVKTAGSMSVPAGDFPNVIKIEVSVGEVSSEDVHSMNVVGTLVCYYAPGVGEIKREVDLTVNIDTTGLGVGDSLVGSFTIGEQLALKRYALAGASGDEVPSEPGASGALEPTAADGAELAEEPSDTVEAGAEAAAPDVQANIGARRRLTSF